MAALRRAVRLAVVGALTATVAVGCVTDRSDDVAVDACGATAGVTEVLIATGGAPTAELRPHLDDLDRAAGADTDALAEAAQQLQDRLDGGDLSDRAERQAWEAALDDLDRQVQARCGFSMQVMVAGSADGGADASSSTTDDLPEPEAGGLGWDEVLSLVGDAAWVDEGYEAAVGEGPGSFVVVYGVESADVALTVCGDVVDALAGTPAADGGLRVEVHGLGGGLLAESLDGACAA